MAGLGFFASTTDPDSQSGLDDDIILLFEQQLNELCSNVQPDTFEPCHNFSYVSVIKINGRPIPPPLVTPEIRAELQDYRQKAIRLEAKLNQRKKQQLVSKVQSIVDDLEEKLTPGSPEDKNPGSDSVDNSSSLISRVPEVAAAATASSEDSACLGAEQPRNTQSTVQQQGHTSLSEADAALDCSPAVRPRPTPTASQTLPEIHSSFSGGKDLISFSVDPEAVASPSSGSSAWSTGLELPSTSQSLPGNFSSPSTDLERRARSHARFFPSPKQAWVAETATATTAVDRATTEEEAPSAASSIARSKPGTIAVTMASDKSTSSSSDTGELNRTVIATADASLMDALRRQNAARGQSSPIWVAGLPNDSDSPASLLGEYKPLPDPVRSSGSPPRVLRPISSRSVAEFQQRAASQGSSLCSSPEKAGSAPTVDLTATDLSLALALATTDSTATDSSLAQSCTLPMSTVSLSEGDATLSGSQELSSASDRTMTLQPGSGGGKERVAPVGRENSEPDDNPAPAAPPGQSESSAVDSGGPLDLSVRRSYTVLNPSPVLLKAISDQTLAEPSVVAGAQADRHQDEADSQVSVSSGSKARRNLNFDDLDGSRGGGRHGQSVRRRSSDQSQPSERGPERLRAQRSPPKRKSPAKGTPPPTASPRNSPFSPGGAGARVVSSASLRDCLREEVERQNQHFEVLKAQLLEQQRRQLQQLMWQQKHQQEVLVEKFQEQENLYEGQSSGSERGGGRAPADPEDSRLYDVGIDAVATANQTDYRPPGHPSGHPLEPAASSKYFPEIRRTSPSTQRSPPKPATATATPAQREPFYLSPQKAQSLWSPKVAAAPRSSQPASPAGSAKGSKVVTPPRRSPGGGSPQLSVSTPLMTSSPHRRSPNAYSRHMKGNFDRVSAVVKGYLTRRLLRTPKIQATIKTIKDTYEFAYTFQSEMAVKKGTFSFQDALFAERLVNQLKGALYELHQVFFVLSTRERMDLLNRSRQLEREEMFRKNTSTEMERPGPKLSEATKRSMERRRQKQKEQAARAGIPTRPKSVAAGRRSKQSTTLNSLLTATTEMTALPRPVTAPPGGTPSQSSITGTLKPSNHTLRPAHSRLSHDQPPDDSLYRPSKYTNGLEPRRSESSPMRSKTQPRTVLSTKTNNRPATSEKSKVQAAKTRSAKRSLYPAVLNRKPIYSTTATKK